MTLTAYLVRRLRALLIGAATLGTLALAGCATSPASSLPAATVETTCASVSAALQTLTLPAVYHRLSATAVASVNAAVTVASPVCAAPSPPTLAETPTAALAQAAAILTALATQYQPTAAQASPGHPATGAAP